MDNMLSFLFEYDTIMHITWGKCYYTDVFIKISWELNLVEKGE